MTDPLPAIKAVVEAARSLTFGTTFGPDPLMWEAAERQAHRVLRAALDALPPDWSATFAGQGRRLETPGLTDEVVQSWVSTAAMFGGMPELPVSGRALRALVDDYVRLRTALAPTPAPQEPDRG